MAEPGADQGIAALMRDSARGACPRCGAPTMFEGPVRFAARCRACGLDYSAFNVGDGPAAFLTLIVGAVTVALALVFDQTVHPPMWLHTLIWVPFTTIAVVGLLRVAKGALLTIEYRKDAREGRQRNEGQQRDEGR